jgi:hypothetical protein
MSSPTLVIVGRRGPASPLVSAVPSPTEVVAAPEATRSSLDEVRIRLAFEHDRHADGPVFPCPLCFRRAV